MDAGIKTEQIFSGRAVLLRRPKFRAERQLCPATKVKMVVVLPKQQQGGCIPCKSAEMGEVRSRRRLWGRCSSSERRSAIESTTRACFMNHEKSEWIEEELI